MTSQWEGEYILHMVRFKIVQRYALLFRHDLSQKAQILYIFLAFMSIQKGYTNYGTRKRGKIVNNVLICSNNRLYVVNDFFYECFVLQLTPLLTNFYPFLRSMTN